MKFILPGALIAALSACSASGDLQVIDQKSTSVRSGSTVALNVESTPEAGDPAEVEKGVAQAKEHLHQRLSEEGPFKSVVGAQGSSDYKMDVVLKEVDEVGGVSQGLFGAFAGANSMSGKVTVTDNSNGLVLTSYNARGDSAAKSLFSTFSGEYTFDSAIQVFGDKVIEGLQ
ncbi:MAG: DUF4410 domain-containing protein [Geminicoccaceae bacterium]